MGRVRAVLLALVAVLALVAAAAWGLLGTTPGARLALGWALPDSARVGAVEGRLWGDLTLRDVRFATSTAELTADRIDVGWRPLALLRGTVDVTGLAVDGVMVRVREATPTPADSLASGIGRPTVPIGIRLRQGTVRNFRAVSATGDTVHMAELATALGARGDRFVLDSLEVRDVRFRGHRLSLHAAGVIVTGAAADRDTADLRVRWSGRLADGRAVDGAGSLAGSGGEFTMEQRLSAPIAADLSAVIQHPWTADSLVWRLSARVPRFPLTAVVDSLAGELEGTVSATGDARSAEAELSLRGGHPLAGEASFDGRVRYADGTLTVDTATLRRVGAPGEVRGGGRIALGSSDPVGEIRVVWRDLGWPLDSARFMSPEGRARLEGRRSAFTAEVAARLDRPDRPLGEWTLSADGGYDDTLAVALNWEGRLPDRPRLRGLARIRYAPDRLRVPELDVRIGEDRGRVWGTADVALADVVRGETDLRWSGVTWPQTGHPDGFTSPAGRVQVSGSLDDFTVTAGADFTGWSAPPSRLDVSLRGAADTSRVDVQLRGRGVAEGQPALAFEARGSYRLGPRVARLDTVDLRLPETGGSLAGRGTVDLSGERVAAEGRLRWRDLGWPVRGPEYWSEEGRADVSTSAGRVRLVADARLGGTGLPDARLRVVGAGDPMARFVVDTVRARLLGGWVLGAGVVLADQGPAWDFTLQGDSLDPGVWQAEWPGRLGFELRTAGRMADDGPRYQVRLDRLAGELRGREVLAAAGLEGAGTRVVVDTLWLQSGDSRLDAAGTVGDTLDVRWRVAAESLTDLAPGVAGRLTAQGEVRGPAEAPTVRWTAEGSDLAAAGWSAVALDAEGDVDAAGAPSSLAVSMSGVEGPSVALDSLTARGNGTRTAHALTVRAVAPNDGVDLRLEGGFADGGWAGRLERLDLRSAQAGDWALRTAAPLMLARDSGAVERLCWAGSGELCLEAQWTPNVVRWEGTGRALPLAFLGPALPQAVALNGEFGLETRGSAESGQVPRGLLRVTGEPGELSYTRDIGQVATQGFDGFHLEATSDSSGIDASAALDLGGLGAIEATARLTGSAPLAERSVTGRVTATLEDTGTVSRFVPSLAETRGHLSAELEVGGTASAPDIHGRVALTDMGAVVTPAGIRLRAGRLVARSTDTGRWEMEGGIASDTGRIDVAGTIRPPSPDSTFRVDMDIRGDRFRAFQTPELLLTASPRLRVQATPDSVRVDGELRIPRGRMVVRRLETTIRESSDVFIVGAEGEPTTDPDSMVTPAAVRADIRLVLGDSVSLNALGVSGRLTGQLGVLAAPGRSPVGSGELNIIDGRYRIYRQTFRIDRGQLLYAATPLTNPALNLRITRQRGPVLAGMEVSGRANDPRIQLFSEPTLSDDEILAYLIVGRPLRRLSQSEGSQVQGMAESIGVAGGNLLLARLSSVFGLGEARLERTTTITADANGQRTQRETSLILGRRILPRVHLDYVIGLTGSTNILRLRYMITDHWILQTESGEETGADLLYSIER